MPAGTSKLANMPTGLGAAVSKVVSPAVTQHGICQMTRRHFCFNCYTAVDAAAVTMPLAFIVAANHTRRSREVWQCRLPAVLHKCAWRGDKLLVEQEGPLATRACRER